MTEPTILLLRHGVHGMNVSEYETALRDRLPEIPIQRAQTPGQEKQRIRDVEVASGIHLDVELVEEAESLRWFACAYAGTDHLPMDRLSEKGITVTNASGVHAPNVSEYVIGALLSIVRRFHDARRRQDQSVWQHMKAGELQGKTVTVVGMGAIGEAVLRRLRPFNVETIGIRHSPEKGGPADDVRGYDPGDLHESFAGSDAVVLCCPLTERTRKLIDEEAFRTLPPRAILINVARGPVIDTEALVHAMRATEIRAAFLDVTDPEPLPDNHPLWNFENVFITPHNAGHTPYYYERLADIVADNVRRIDETGEWVGLKNQVLP